jgi:hypothetical protein
LSSCAPAPLPPRLLLRLRREEDIMAKHTVYEDMYDPFIVTDDGEPKVLYGVWYKDPRKKTEQWSLLGSGMKVKNALAIAEALRKTRGQPLTESLDL